MELKVVWHSRIKVVGGERKNPQRGGRGGGANHKAIELDPEAKRHLWRVLRQGVIEPEKTHDELELPRRASWRRSNLSWVMGGRIWKVGREGEVGAF